MARYKPDDPRNAINRAKLVHTVLHWWHGTDAEIPYQTLRAGITFALGVHGKAVDDYIRTLKDGGFITTKPDPDNGRKSLVIIHAPPPSVTNASMRERADRLKDALEEEWSSQT